MNTIEDLECVVAEKLRNAIDGETFGSDDEHIRLPQMLGIVDVGEPAHTDSIDGTLLDAEHEFWDDYVMDINGRLAAADEVDRATRRLSNKGVLTIERDGDIMDITVGEYE